MPERILVLLLTYGEPERARFTDQYRYSLSILRRLTRKIAPIPKPLLPLIAARRGWVRVRNWRREEYTSPLDRITYAQCAALSAVLHQVDTSRLYEVCVVFEFKPPLLKDVLTERLAREPSRLLLVPLYLAESDFTHGISRLDLDEFAARRGHPVHPVPEYVTGFSEDDQLVELCARFVREQVECAGWCREDCVGAGLLLGAHGTLVNGPPGVETGLVATQRFYDRLAERLAPMFHSVSIGWLNHALGGEWTSPDLETATRQMVQRGLHRVVYFPFGFLADNAESQLEGRCVLRDFESLQVLHLDCLNAWPPFVEYLAQRIVAVVRSNPEASACSVHLPQQ